MILTPNKRWPVFIFCLALLFIGVTGWSVRQAWTNGSPILDRQYYQHGLAYDQGQKAERAAAALGWQLHPRLDHNSLLLILTAADGQPVSGAEGRAQIALHQDRTDRVGSRIEELALAEIAAGVYALSLPANRVGQALNLRITKGGASISRRLLLEAGSLVANDRF